MEENLNKIIGRIKDIKHLSTDADVAKTIGISRENLNNYKKRNAVPRKALEIFCLQESISLEWILHGTGPINTGNPSTQAVHESVAEYSAIGDLITAAVKVLTSENRMAAEALEKNIRYFSHAIEVEKRFDALESSHKSLEKEVGEIRDKVFSSGGSRSIPDQKETDGESLKKQEG